MPAPVTFTRLTGAQHDAAVGPDLTSLSAAIVSDLTALLADLIASGAALGWVQPPSQGEIDGLLRSLTYEGSSGDASTVLAHERQQLIAFGCWRRYQRPTHRPHADLPYLAVAQGCQSHGVGGLLLDRLIADTRAAQIEQLTLDSRGDNEAAHGLWRSRGFVEYGRLKDFVAVGEARYDKTFWVLDLRNTRGAGANPTTR
jgi:ribosomal protein S18 acetylase RimI-like enzyme